MEILHQNGAHGTTRNTNVEIKTGNVWDFLTATRDLHVFREIQDNHPDFDLADVPEAEETALLVWRLRIEFDSASIEESDKLDECVERALCVLVSSDDPVAGEALQWLRNGEIYRLPTERKRVARRVIKEWIKAEAMTKHVHESSVFEFSTDADLDDLLGSVEWLWHRYIARGFVTGLVAPQDEGKSTVAQDFCRTLLIGGRWPDGTECGIPAEKLLWIDTDGNLALFHQRLKTWGMPRGRFIFPPDALQELTIDNAANWRWIEQAIEKFAPPLVVIDALSGSHSGKENDTDSMKAIMKRLHALAQKYKVAILVIHHLNKAPFGVASYPLTVDRLRGSSSISQFCRSILALTTPDSMQPDARRLDVIKLNLAKKPPAVGYVLTDNGPAWGNAPEPPREQHVADDAAQFLQVALAGGRRPAGEVLDEAKANGLTDYALRAARKTLRVQVEKSRGVGARDAPWTWRLPDDHE